MSGGMNTISDPVALQPNQLRRANNARLTEYGAATKRGGTQRTSSAVLASAPVQNGYLWPKDSGAKEIMVVCNGRLYTSTFGAFPMTYTLQTGAMTADVPVAFAQFRDGANDVVYIADGGALNRWDGTTLSVDLANTPSVTDIVVHNQRLWGCGDSANPDSIFYSALNDGDSLGYAPSNGGQIVVRTFGDERIVGLASVGTSLIIFHRRGLSRLTGYGQDDITVAPAGITQDVGIIAPKSIVNVRNMAYFLSERGLYRCNEAEVEAVGTAQTPDPLLPIIQGLTSSEFGDIRAAFSRATRELWITIPQVGIYVYHTVLNAWTGPFDEGYLTPDTTALFEALDESGLPILLRGDEDGWVSLCDPPGLAALDNINADGTGGTRFTMTLQFHRMFCGDDALAKSARWGYLTANLRGSDQCAVQWESDQISSTYELPVSSFGLWGVGTWGTGTWTSGTSRSYRIPMGGLGYFFDVRVIDSGEGLPVISRFQLETFSLGRR